MTKEPVCSACGRGPVVTDGDYTNLCQSCLDRAGDPLMPGAHVICTDDPHIIGTVIRIEDDGCLAVIALTHGGDAWVPVAELVAMRW